MCARFQRVEVFYNFKDSLFVLFDSYDFERKCGTNQSQIPRLNSKNSGRLRFDSFVDSHD